MPPLRLSPTVCSRCLAHRFFSTTSPVRTTSIPPPPPPPTAYAHLTNRALISLSGQDAARFLQGLTTANMPPNPAPLGVPPNSIYSAFLNAQGRILNDVFIYPMSGQKLSGSESSGFLIEVDADEQDRLLKWLKRYKLRAKIQLRAINKEEWSVWSAWDDFRPTKPSNCSPTTSSSEGLHFSDVRAPSFGTRILLPSSSQPSSPFPSPSSLGLPENSTPATLLLYTLRRHLHGIPEGQTELQRENALVQESCMDYMGGVDFRKGCYVGQELVIRTQHTGVVRKRVLPLVLYRGAEEKQGVEGVASGPEGLRYDEAEARELGEVMGGVNVGADIVKVGGKERRVGRWMGGVGNVGLALWRLESLEGGFRIRREGGESDGRGVEVMVKPFVPGWWSERKVGTGSL